MEIMKIFSSYDDYGYEDERLYSVLMNEDELALFSDMKEEEEKKGMSKGAKVALGVGGATAATGAGIYGANKVGKVLVNKAMKNGKNALVDLSTKEGQRLNNAVKRQIKVGELLQKPAKAIAKRVAKK